MRIILASQSPQRQMLLATLPVTFEVVPSNIDEKAIVHSDPRERARLVARAKGEKIARQYPDAIVIAADTFTLYKGTMYEKPSSLEDAKRMLRELSGQTFNDLTGFFYHDPQGKHVEEVLQGEAVMRPLRESEIETYVNNNPVTTWAGAYSAGYLEGAALFSEVRGNLTAFMYGLPIDRVAAFLAESGAMA